MATYYFSQATGDDTRTAAQAQSQSTPWKTAAKIMSGISINAGDQFLFECGGVYGPSYLAWTGETYPLFIDAKNGTSASPIVIGQYGSGARPKFTSMKTATSPVAVSGRTNIYSYNVGVWEELTIVRIDAALKSVARYPKLGTGGAQNGYLMGKTHLSGQYNSIAQFSLNNAPPSDFTGGDFVTKNNHYTIGVHKITAQSGTTLTVQLNTGVPENQYGYFFQNHINCLTQNGDWAFDRAAGKLYVYFSDAPSNHVVEYAYNNNTCYVLSSNYLQFNNIEIEGANVFNVKLQNCTTVAPTFINCKLSLAGMSFFQKLSANNAKVINCVMNDSYSGGIDFSPENPVGDQVSGNVLTNSGIVLGAHRFTNEETDNAGVRNKNQPLATNGVAISNNSTNGIVEKNRIMYCGYNGINFGNGANTLVDRNYVYMSCYNTMDGSSIYTYGNVGGDPTANWTATQKRIVSNNICISALGDAGGTPDTSYHPTYGIYIDDMSRRVDITNNLMVGAGDAGLYYHHTQYCIATGNTTFDCRKAVMIKYGDNDSSRLPAGNDISGNTFVVKNPDQFLYDITIISNATFATTQPQDVCTFSNNKVFIPYRYDDFVIRIDKTDPAFPEGQRWHNLASWQTKYGRDAGTTVDTPSGYLAAITATLVNEPFTTNALASTFVGYQQYGARQLSVSGGELVSSVTASNGNRDGFMLPYSGAATLANTSYIIRFKTRSAAGSFVVQAFLNNYPNGDKLNHFRVTPTQTQVELFFPAPPTGASINLVFETENSNGTFYIDDYSISTVNVSYPDTSAALKAIYNDQLVTANVPFSGGSFSNIVTGVDIGTSPVSLGAMSWVIAKTGSGTPPPPPPPPPTGGGGTGTNITSGGGGGNKRKRRIISIP